MRSNIRLFLAIALSAAICLFMIPSGTNAETGLAEEDIIEATFTNSLDWSTYYLFISPSDSEYYGADVLESTGAYILDPYSSILLYMTPGEYDVLILDEDYDMWYGTFTIADGDDVVLSEATLTYEEYGVYDALINIDIIVETTVSVEYLFLSPADSDEWGVDLLGLSTLEPDDTLTLTLPEYDANMDYDLLAILEDGQQVTVAVEAFDGAEFYLYDPSSGVDDDDDVVDDDDIVTDDDDDVVVDDDDDIVTDDDDDLPPEEQPGGVPVGGGEGLEGDEDDPKKTNALGIFAIIATSMIFIGVRWLKRKE